MRTQGFVYRKHGLYLCYGQQTTHTGRKVWFRWVAELDEATLTYGVIRDIPGNDELHRAIEGAELLPATSVTKVTLIPQADSTVVEQPQGRPTNCRQRLSEEGKPYPRSSCNVCGTLLRANWSCPYVEKH